MKKHRTGILYEWLSDESQEDKDMSHKSEYSAIRESDLRVDEKSLKLARIVQRDSPKLTLEQASRIVFEADHKLAEEWASMNG